jgi:pimeloyl-ACP methyl ester carboxylesterase
MSTFCLVHGSTQDACCWNLLAPELEKRAYQIVRPALPTDEPTAGVERYAGIILKSIPDEAGDVVVVGHSASGYLLPLVAAQRRLRRIVFLAAMIPQIGQSFLDQVRSDPTIFQPGWVGKDPTVDDVAAKHFLFHDCSPEVTEWAMTTRIRLPLEKVAGEVYPLQQWPDVASTYIVCSNDRTISPDWSRRVARERLGVQAVEIASGHCPYLSRPSDLANLLSQLG